MTTSQNQRLRILHGLEARIRWCVAHDRPNEEMAKLAKLIVATAEKFVREDALEAFYADLEAIAQEGD